MKNREFPKISIVIPTFNEEANIVRALESIYKQEYPTKCLEVIIVDDYSTDNTLALAKKFPVKILKNGSYDGEVGKMIGLQRATGDFFYYFDADMELIGTNWFQSMLLPFSKEKDIAGAFTRNYARRSAPSLERYFAMDPIHRDPVFEFFSPSVESTIIADNKDYKLCKYTLTKIPPAARCLYRMTLIKEITKGEEKFMELDILTILVKKGMNTFAYVTHPGKYHHHAKSLLQLIRKRRRNVNKVYLPTISKREYTWFNLKDSRDVMKILLLIFYAHTLVFSTARGLYKSLKWKDIAGMWEPVVTLVITDTIIFSFLVNIKGVHFIMRSYLGKLSNRS